MLYLVAAATALLTPATSEIVHRERVEHAGTAYDIHYSPQLETSAKTVGAAAGTRASQQKCRWKITVNARREISNAGRGAPLVKVLPERRSLTGETFGDCRHNVAAVQKAQAARMGEVRQIMQAFAQADRPHVGMDIDAAHALAAN
ncbi:MAG TPA: hypothetical protein VF503_21605 [Sphingobium sp.]|uniref:hypothetical protein n=1 Tax=Sphingobium sp. TaxID=1912891 RepID=UPI002ED2A4A0